MLFLPSILMPISSISNSIEYLQFKINEIIVKVPNWRTYDISINRLINQLINYYKAMNFHLRPELRNH